MAMYKKDGFVFYDGFFNKPVFNLDSDNIEKKIQYIYENNIKNISIDISVDNFDFFKKLKFIEEIYISDNINVEDLYHLDKLKRMIVNVSNNKPNINFSKFLTLEILSIDWYNNFPDLSMNESLKELSIWKFKPKTKSFEGLKLPKNLKKLHITESNILTLEGLSSDLEIFEGHYCNSLRTVKGIKNFSENLQVLILDYCRQLNDYEELKFSTELNKIILGNCGDIPSLQWLKNLNKVKHFSFWNTKLLDGDTSPCLGIDYVSFQNKKHYNHKIEEFQ